MKLLITGAAQLNPELILSLENLGWEVTILKQEKDGVEAPEFYDAVVCNNLFAHTPVERFSNLKFIQLTSAGLDRVPLSFIRDHGIIIKNARGVYSKPMAEWVIAVILNEYKALPGFALNQKEKSWIKNRNLKELTDKKIAIIGAGNIGDEIAKRLKAFDTQIDGFDVAEFSKSDYDKILHIEKLDPANYDIIIISAPSTKDNYHFIDGDFLRKMKKDSMLINISRGNLLDESSIISALTERPDLVLCLDVFEQEPLGVSSKLWEFDNVRISPHNSFVGEYNSKRLHKVIIQNLEEFLQKESEK